MGRAERHAGDHKPTTLQVAVDAARLHHHTCLIMRNPKFFNPEHDFSSMTLVNIFETTLEIYLRIYEANAIKANTPELARERLSLQSFAMVTLERMQALQALARGMFSKLRGDTSKFWYWCSMAEKLKLGLKAWREADAKRLAPLLAAPKEDLDGSDPGRSGCRLNSSLGGQCPPAVC